MPSFIFSLQKRKERGRVILENVHYVEGTQTSNQADEFPFQVGYQETTQDHILYLFASREQDRTDWVLALRKGNYFIHFLFKFSCTFI